MPISDVVADVDRRHCPTVASQPVHRARELHWSASRSTVDSSSTDVSSPRATLLRPTREPDLMDTTRAAMTPIGALARGLAAGAVGTLALDLVGFAAYRRGGGTSSFPDWELSADLDGWDGAPAPAQVGKRLVEGLFQIRLPAHRARLVNNVTHWGYGMFGGAQYGLVVGSLRAPRIWYGVPFGAGFWGSGYVVLPAAKLYKPIWEYDRATLAKDLGAHLAYGLTTSAVFRLLSPRRRRGA